MHNFRLVVLLCAAAVLTACGAAEPKWAPDAEVARSTYVHDGPTAITLFTVLSKKSNAGAHSGLLVNAPSQRALFDPAGTFYHPHLPERNDVHFGMTDAAVDFYIDYHARVSYDVVAQTIYVTPDVAQIALARIQAYGAVSKAQCAASISSILRDLPGFESLDKTVFPKRIYKWFEKQPHVITELFEDDSPNDNGRLVQAPPLLLQ